MNVAAQKVKSERGRTFMDRILDARKKNLPPMQKLCLLVLASRADANEVCWPSLETIADDMGCSRRTAIRSMKALEALGLVTVVRATTEAGKCAPNRYRIACGNSDRVAPLQCQRVTRVVSESHQGGDTVALEVTTEDTTEEKREARERDASTTNVVEFPATVAKPAPLETEETPKVVFRDDGSLDANGAFRRFWLPEYDNDAWQLDLAIIEATPWVQPNTSKPLEALLSSQLARQVRDRKDRDRRYAQKREDNQQQTGGFAALLDRLDAESAAAEGRA